MSNGEAARKAVLDEAAARKAAYAATEEKTFTVELTERELHHVRDGLSRVIRYKYSEIGAYNPYVSHEYCKQVVEDAEFVWGLVERLARLSGCMCEPEGGTVEGEPTPLPDESEAERSEQ